MMERLEIASVEMKRRSEERNANLLNEKQQLDGLVEFMSSKYRLESGRKRPRLPEEKSTLERWAKDGYKYGTI
jgi:hypothetical protein